MNTLKFKKGDEVKVIAGSHKGKTATIAVAYPRKNAVTLEGIGMAKRKVKPSQSSPKGGTKEIHVPIDASKVALVNSSQHVKPANIVKAAGKKKEGKK